jgi:hypothetical protein
VGSDPPSIPGRFKLCDPCGGPLDGFGSVLILRCNFVSKRFADGLCVEFVERYLRRPDAFYALFHLRNGYVGQIAAFTAQTLAACVVGELATVAACEAVDQAGAPTLAMQEAAQVVLVAALLGAGVVAVIEDALDTVK